MKSFTIFSIALLSMASADDCNSKCIELTYAKGGYPLGTAPSCSTNCDEDCPGKHCIAEWSQGNGCWTGSKICCCKGENAAEMKAARCKAQIARGDKQSKRMDNAMNKISAKFERRELMLQKW